MLVFNQDNKLFLGERNGEPGIWQFPQGGVEAGLSLEENVLRELEEELGLNRKNLEIIKKLNATHVYDFRNIPDYAVGKWRGQSQTFWLVKFLGSNLEIDLFAHEPEFMNFCWCSVDEVREKAEPIRLPGYEAALVEFSEYLSE